MGQCGVNKCYVVLYCCVFVLCMIAYGNKCEVVKKKRAAAVVCSGKRIALPVSISFLLRRYNVAQGPSLLVDYLGHISICNHRKNKYTTIQNNIALVICGPMRY